MKTNITILLLFLTTIVSAQMSLKVGVNRAELNVNDKEFYDVKPKTNYMVGLHYLFSFNEVVGLESGLMYQRFSTDFKGGPDIYDIDRDYIAIPVLLKFNPGTVFSAGAGLQASFKVKDSFRDNFNNNDFDLSAQIQATINIFKSLGIELSLIHI